MKRTFNLIVLALCFASYCNGQVYFPFKSEDSQSSILAYWYNCKSDSVIFEVEKETTNPLTSTLQIYGPFVADSFYVKAEVYFKDGSCTYSNNFLIDHESKSKDYKVHRVNDFFVLTTSVDQLVVNPEKIKITISTVGENIEKWIYCKYHKLYGKMYDFKGNPMKAFILISPDDFSSNMTSGVWSDSSGYYEIDLPERVYNTFYVNDGKYKVTTLEGWAWHMIMDEEQQLDFKIGTGEVYNLHVWPSNGGGLSFFISFRPMVLFYNNIKEGKQELNGKVFPAINIAPDLEIKDIIVTINGKKTDIISLQKYFETGSNFAMPAYIIQLPRERNTFGKQTIKVEYNKMIEKDGKEVYQNSVGYYQFITNFSGLSDFN